MKKLIVFALLLFVFLAAPGLAVAKTPKPVVTVVQAPVESEIPQEAPVMEKKDEYLLPYPGMLPDHPLYVIKRLRDWILDKLIADPLRRVEFNILQADKRLNMGIFLAQKGNAQLAEEVISKGEKYLNSALFGLLALKTEGKEVPSYLVERLMRSLEKHEVELKKLSKTITTAQKAGIEASLKLVEQLQGEMEKLK